MDKPTDTTNATAVEIELAAARISWKKLAIKPSRVQVSSGDSEVGWGGYATVHRATLGKRWRRWIKMPVAIKKLSVPEDREGRLRIASALLQELGIWAQLKHPNILPLRGFYISDDLNEMWLISDLATIGNLLTYLESGDHPLDERLSLAGDTAEGLNYLHTRTPPICHGDIKSLNVLIGANRRCLICDFGTASQEERASPARDITLPRVGGTTRYSSPELFDEASCMRPTRASDVWSWGCLCHEIVTGLGPYNDVVMEAQVIHRISARVPPAPLDRMGCPDSVRELLSGCWRVEPDRRPTMSQCSTALRRVIIQVYRKGKSLQSRKIDANLDRLEVELNEVLESLKDHRIEPSTITFPPSGGIVGQGGCGVVVRATMTRKGRREELVAVKKLRAHGGRERCLQMIIAVIRELRVSANLDHPNVLAFIGFHVTPTVNEAWLVSSFIPNGDLSCFLHRWTLSDEERTKLALDTARGLEYLHSLSICHGDIKSANILVKGDRQAVLCDFGLAKSMESMPTGLTTTTFNEAGTLSYESPELILGRSRRSPQSDVWAWGCVLHEIFTRKPPYHWANGPGAIIKWITTNIPPGVLVEGAFPPFIRQVLVVCWQSDASRRPTMTECIHAFSGENISSLCLSDRAEGSMRMTLMSSELGFRKNDILGSGTHGTVYRGTMTKQGSDTVVKAAVKGLPPTDLEEEEREHFFREIRDGAADWDGLQHPNVLPFLGFSLNPWGDPEVLIVSPLVTNGNLSDYLKRESLSYERKMELAKGIAEGLLYLHTRNLYHGNLHPRNILMNDKGSAMLSDYCFAGVMDKAHIKIKSPGGMETSSRYWSPGVNAGAARGTRDDVWSWGCVLLEIVTGRIPYDGVDDVPAVVDDLDCPPRVQNLLGLCWKKNQNLQSAISEIVAILDGRSFRYENVSNIRLYPSRRVGCFTLSQDGTRVAVARENMIEVHSADNGKRLLPLYMPRGSETPESLRFSRSGRYLVVIVTDGLDVWDTCAGPRPGKFISPILRLKGKMEDADISRDDAMVASVSMTGNIQLSRLMSPRRERQIVPIKKARLIALSPTSDIIAAGLVDGEIQIFNVVTGRSLALLGENLFKIRLLSFSPNGRWLLEGSKAGLRAWDASRLTELLPEATFHNKLVEAASMSPDDNTTVAFIENTGDIHVSTNSFGGPALKRKVGTLSYDPYLKSKYDVVMTAGGSSVAIAWTSDATRMPIYKFGSYDSPGTYRIDPTSTDEDDAPGSTTS